MHRVVSVLVLAELLCGLGQNRISPASLYTVSSLSTPQVLSVLHQLWLCAVACPCHPRAMEI